MRNFSNLPEEIIDDIGQRLHNIEDFVRFGAVCKSWQSVAAAIAIRKQTTSFSCFAPWMMLATYGEDNDPHKGIQKFFSISNKRVFSINLPHTQGRMCWGSPFGWLVTIDIDHNVHILNPLSRIQFSLPPLFTLGRHYHNQDVKRSRPVWTTNKFVLSSAPSIDADKYCVVMAIAVQTSFDLLFVAKPGDKAWTSVQAPRSEYVDAMLYNDRFYTINDNGVQMVCDFNESHPTASTFCLPPEHFHYMGDYYLVEMSGDFVLIERIFVDKQDSTIWRSAKGFYLYKLDFHTRTWTELSDLGDNALFLGNNTSFAISTSDFPEFKLKRNCIYFTGGHPAMYGYDDYTVNIFDCSKNTLELLYEGDDMFSDFSRPVFIMPNL